MTKEEYFIEVWSRCTRNQGCLPVVACVFFAAILLFSSCATKTKIEFRDRIVDHYHTVTVHDTLREGSRDSIYHEIKTVNDTVYDTKVVEKTRWKDKIVEKHDTCWRDSVDIQYKEVEKEVVKYPKTYWWLLGISIISVIFAGIKLTRWLRII